jgi:UDP-N-acetyl-D-glucosamine dehydrogenase
LPAPRKTVCGGCGQVSRTYYDTRVVGGLDPRSVELAATLYGAVIVRVVRISSPEVAEACKILENTYRAINIALVNELKVLYDHMGIDVWEVIEAAKTKPFGFQAFCPGPGLGGHCIPIDPFYLSRLRRGQGGGLPQRPRPGGQAEQGGAARHGVQEGRGRPARVARLRADGVATDKGAVVTYNDPHIPQLPRMRHYPTLRMASQPLTAEYLQAQDCVLIVTDHSAFDWPWVVEHSRLVVDTRNACRGVTAHRERIVKA